MRRLAVTVLVLAAVGLTQAGCSGTDGGGPGVAPETAEQKAEREKAAVAPGKKAASPSGNPSLKQVD